MTDVTAIDWFALAPELTLLTTALLALFVDLFLRGDSKRLVNPMAIIGCVVAIAWVAALAIDGAPRQAFGNMFVVDGYALLFKAFFLTTAVFVLLTSYRYFTQIRTYQGEYYFLLLAAFLGMLLMPSARDLVMIFIALELVSVPGFVMAGLRKFDLRSNEAALKFFVFGVLSVTILLFGLSIVYGFTGTTDLAGVADALRAMDRSALIDARREPLLLGAMLFVVVGFGFKVSAVPFHFWAPDTYEGSPVPVAAFLSVASKAAGFAGLLQIMFVAFEPYADVWAPVLGVVSVLTMTLGNIMALQQRNIVRLFAYSSIAHAGYMLLPFALVRPGAVEVNEQAFGAVLIYLLAYAVMNIGAFAVVTAVTEQHPGRQVGDYAGLGARAPGLAAALTVFLISLGGVPPAVGFWAKFFVFLAAADAGAYVLAGILVVNSVIAMFYYLAIARTMWMDQPVAAVPIRPGFALNVAVGALAIAALVIFVVPDLFAASAGASTL
ncbi:MAG TPA: NADH-quinone oxidoreductase subunit N, partial [Egibacteraceae bacterium]|nr:NADH-quinone oxidoreductase subunit N [Egibacteraceae bacterium]